VPAVNEKLKSRLLRRRGVAGLHLRTKFLLSMLLVSAALTTTTLLVVRLTVQNQVRREIQRDLGNSVLTFQDFQRQREETLARSAQLLADLPNVRALMTTRDRATIQDASRSTWRLAGSDLFVLADPSAKIMAMHVSDPGPTTEAVSESLRASLQSGKSTSWWYGNHHLYEVFVQPIYFGGAAENRMLGSLAIGYEINDQLAQDISRVAASQVAFRYGGRVVESTLSPAQEEELQLQAQPLVSAGAVQQPIALRVGNERFLATSVLLSPEAAQPVRLVVLKSVDQAIGFLDDLNRVLLVLGLLAVLGGSLLAFLISHTFTRPLANLVDGVRALEQGNYSFPLDSHGGDEVAEVSAAFDRMRASLQKSRQQLIESERLATIGRMASSISHDLRHSLASVVANGEFLCESHLTSTQREELYNEILTAVTQMTDMIESLLEFSRTRESLRPSFGNLQKTLQYSVQVIRALPQYQGVRIDLDCEGSSDGWFDSRRMERVFHNLLLNACEALPKEGGRIDLRLRQIHDGVELRVCDNGSGVAQEIQDQLFQPFVSYGKENGTGMGLTVVQKIVQDHGGDVTVERSSTAGTVFQVVLPLAVLPGNMPPVRAKVS
jgi:signal transduction histidine kinase